MRQAGFLAAAGLVALDEMVERLAEDHARARILAGLFATTFPESDYDPTTCRTNIVAFNHPKRDSWSKSSRYSAWTAVRRTTSGSLRHARRCQRRRRHLRR